MLLMDVDGVLTDGRLYNVPAPNGEMAETKVSTRRTECAAVDGRMNFPCGLISGAFRGYGRTRQAVQFKYVYQGHTRRFRSLRKFSRTPNRPAAVAYIGDDFTDVG